MRTEELSEQNRDVSGSARILLDTDVFSFITYQTGLWAEYVAVLGTLRRCVSYMTVGEVWRVPSLVEGSRPR